MYTVYDVQKSTLSNAASHDVIDSPLEQSCEGLHMQLLPHITDRSSEWQLSNFNLHLKRFFLSHRYSTRAVQYNDIHHVTIEKYIV